MIKLLIGGSPCTYWSIAKKNGRETEAEGLGWELFKNYLIAKEKFNPDFFLYENNKSAAQAIKDQIKKELKVWDGTLLMEDTCARYIEINSALVSAQNRQRFYVHNCGEVKQPEDRGILLKDILESGVGQRQQEKSRTITAGYSTCSQRDMRMDIETGGFMGKQGVIEAIPVNTTADGKAGAIRATCYKDTVRNLVGNDYDRRTCVAVPIGITAEGKSFCLTASYSDAVAWNTVERNQRSMVSDPIRCGSLPRPNGELSTSQAMRIYSVNGKSVTQSAGGGGMGGKTGLYAVPVENPESYLGEKMVGYAYKEGTKNFKQRVKILEDKACPLTTEQNKRAGTTNYIPQAVETVDCMITMDGSAKNAKPIYEVKDGLITIKGKQYPIKLADGYYIIRKLTVTECARLQTMPDDYCRAVSNAQAYKGLGNGWTAEVIIHILNGALKDVPKDEEIVVLSMYDGIGTGRYCLDKIGFTNVKYYAYEIDKYAMQVALSNYPDIIECGDAFSVRNKNWSVN